MSIDQTMPPAGGETLKLEQRAELGGFLSLSLKNGLLNIVTLTLYRFWGRTEVRRRIWSSTYVNGEALEYTGRGQELFLGFLLALAVVVLPLLVVVFLVQMLGPQKAVPLILLVEVFLVFIIGVGVFTAFRYIASRTVWRGVRFQLSGSAVGFASRMFAYIVMTGVTLGWFTPAMRRKMARNLWKNLKFGDKPFRFDEEASKKEPVYGAFALGWLGILVLYIVFSATAFGLAFAGMRNGGPPEPRLHFVIVIYLAALLFGLLAVALFAPFQAAMLRAIVAGIVIEEARFKIRVSWVDMLWMTLSSLLMVTFSLGFLMPFAEARILKFFINRISSQGTVDLAGVHQAGRGPRTGEGIADAFGLSPL